MVSARLLNNNLVIRAKFRTAFFPYQLHLFVLRMNECESQIGDEINYRNIRRVKYFWKRGFSLRKALVVFIKAESSNGRKSGFHPGNGSGFNSPFGH